MEKQSKETWERIRQGLYPVDPFTRMTPEMWEVLEKAQKKNFKKAQKRGIIDNYEEALL